MSQSKDDIACQIGIFLGAEWSVGDIAKHLGVTPQTVSARIKRNRALVEILKGWTRVAISKHIEERIKKAEDSIDERKKRIHSKGYKLIEKKLDHGLTEAETLIDEETGEPYTIETKIDAAHLKAAEMAIDRVEGKALDRKAILERRENVYRVEVDGGDLDGILNEAARLNEMRKQALLMPPEDVTEAEIVNERLDQLAAER